MAQELKAYNVVATVDVNPEVVDNLRCTEFAAYDADEVDAVLAEKDTEIAELKQKLQDHCIHCPVKEQEDDVVANLQNTNKVLAHNGVRLNNMLAEKDKEIAELKDKCQMHDFFLEGCGFAKRGFKNSIAVREAFDKLEAENESLQQQNRELCQALQVMYSKEECDKQKYKRCLAMAKWCGYFANYWECCEPPDCGAFIARAKFNRKWHKRWLELAEKFKDKETK